MMIDVAGILIHTDLGHTENLNKKGKCQLYRRSPYTHDLYFCIGGSRLLVGRILNSFVILAMSDSFAHCWAQPYIYRNLRFQDFATAATVLWATGNKYNTWKYLKTYSWMGKFICVIICIAICLISWICNSWIRILAGCLLRTAHCLLFPTYFYTFLAYCVSYFLLSSLLVHVPVPWVKSMRPLGPLALHGLGPRAMERAAGRMGEARPTEPRPWELQKTYTMSCFTNIEPCQLWRKTCNL